MQQNLKVVNLELSVKHLTENLHLAREKLSDTRNRENLAFMQFSVERKQLEDKIKRLETEQHKLHESQHMAKEMWADEHEARVSGREEDFSRDLGEM